MNFEYAFDEGLGGWKGDFVDLPVGYDEEIYQLEFKHDNLPESLGRPDMGLMISGNNASDDLFMFIKRGMGVDNGIQPLVAYLLTMEVELATNAPEGSVGIGGSPGESVYVKIGASTEEPVPVITDLAGEPYYRLSVDKGDQNEQGTDAVVAGNVAKVDSRDFSTYEIKTLNNRASPIEVRAGTNGTLWVFVGTDSGFEGTTTLYYIRIRVSLKEV